MDSENHNDCNQREVQNNTVEAMDTEEGKPKVCKCKVCYTGSIESIIATFRITCNGKHNQ